MFGQRFSLSCVRDFSASNNDVAEALGGRQGQYVQLVSAHIYIYIFFKITTYKYIYIYIFHGLDPVMTMHVREFSLRRANPNFGSFSVPFLLLGWRPLQKTNILDDCPISS